MIGPRPYSHAAWLSEDWRILMDVDRGDTDCHAINVPCAALEDCRT